MQSSEESVISGNLPTKALGEIKPVLHLRYSPGILSMQFFFEDLRSEVFAGTSTDLKDPRVTCGGILERTET